MSDEEKMQDCDLKIGGSSQVLMTASDRRDFKKFKAGRTPYGHWFDGSPLTICCIGCGTDRLQVGLGEDFFIFRCPDCGWEQEYMGCMSAWGIRL